MFTDSSLDAYIISVASTLVCLLSTLIAIIHTVLYFKNVSVLAVSVHSVTVMSGRLRVSNHDHLNLIQQIAGTGIVANWHFSFVYELLFIFLNTCLLL